jgi:hypothetical protein
MSAYLLAHERSKVPEAITIGQGWDAASTTPTLTAPSVLREDEADGASRSIDQARGPMVPIESFVGGRLIGDAYPC